jgi:hypothetical protein
MLMNKRILDILKESYLVYLKTHSRSNRKLKILHGFIKRSVLNYLNQEKAIQIEALSLDTSGLSKELSIRGRYYEKKVDIAFKKGNKVLSAIGVKFIMSNYSQNSNNYFENMLGETANLRTRNIPYFQIFIIPEKVPYFDKGGKIKKWENVTQGDKLKKYKILDEDNTNIFYHTPLLTLLLLIRLELNGKSIDKYQLHHENELKNLILSNQEKFQITLSNKLDEKQFGNTVIFNDYELFLKKLVYYLNFKY